MTSMTTIQAEKAGATYAEGLALLTAAAHRLRHAGLHPTADVLSVTYGALAGAAVSGLDVPGQAAWLQVEAAIRSVTDALHNAGKKGQPVLSAERMEALRVAVDALCTVDETAFSDDDGSDLATAGWREEVAALVTSD